MHPALIEVDQLYREIEIYMFSTRDYLLGLNKEQSQEFFAHRDEARTIEEAATNKFLAIVSTLSPSEIIEAYNLAGRELRANLRGYILRHFDAVYIPLMIRAIET